jgi:hypothetical protein
MSTTPTPVCRIIRRQFSGCRRIEHIVDHLCAVEGSCISHPMKVSSPSRNGVAALCDDVTYPVTLSLLGRKIVLGRRPCRARSGRNVGYLRTATSRTSPSRKVRFSSHQIDFAWNFPPRRNGRQNPGRAAMSMARLWPRSGKAAGGSRASRSGLRLVHRRLRYTRSEGSEGVAR